MGRAARSAAAALGLLAGTALLAAPGLALAAAGTAGSPQVHMVVMRGMTFEPPTLEVRPGDKVVWRNGDVVPHDVKGPGFKSPTVNPGDSFVWTATGKGEIAYKCTLHPKMDGVLVVSGR